MNDSLFSEFDSVSSKQWKQKIQFDLNGADYNDTLVWKTNEDILVKPFYHADDFEKLPEVSNTHSTAWEICQSIFVYDVKKSNLNAIEAIARGAESIKFIIPSEEIIIEELLKNLNQDGISIHFELEFLSDAFVKKLSYSPSIIKSHIHTDIIGNLARSGNWFNNLKEDFQTQETCLERNEYN